VKKLLRNHWSFRKTSQVLETCEVLDHWPFLLLLAALTAYHVWGITKVPFHPDEATQLYMSSDFEALFAHPGSLMWDSSHEGDRQQRYRELDAPLTKYILGLGRRVFGLQPLPVDWNWGQSWEENARAGALPDAALLFAGRLAVTLLLPLSLSGMYLLGLQVEGRLTGFLAALLLGTHPLVLLHARRAMAEGALVLGVVIGLLTVLGGGKRPWLAGLGLGLAFNAKQSLAGLLPVGLLAVVWGAQNDGNRLRRAGLGLLQFSAAFVLVTLALNPLYWSDPAGAARASLAARQDLLTRQMMDLERFTPERVLRTPGQRAAVLLAHLYVIPPRFEEVGNYVEQTAASKQAYLAVPGHVLLRGPAGGGLMLAITLFGAALAARRVWKNGWQGERNLTLLLLAGIFQFGALILAIPLPFQRYAMPLVPFTALWAAYGLGALLTHFRRS